MNLNLGCGQDIRPKPDWVNIDLHPGPCVDIVLDLRKDKLPFDDGIINQVYASHLFEHLPEWETLLIEIGRVLMPHGTAIIKVPYMNFEGQHLRQFDETTMNPFIELPRKGNVIGSGSAGLDSYVLFELAAKMVKRILWLRSGKGPYPKTEITWVLRRMAPSKEKCDKSQKFDNDDKVRE